MAFAIMDIQKIKTRGAMVSKYNHNCRKVDVANAIPELANRNENLISLAQENGQELNYREVFEKRMNELPYYRDHKIRKNQVLGYEIMLSYSRDESIDVEAWKAASVEWLKKEFNVAPDGKNNVVHAVFHGDEVGNAHIHAFVIPIDGRGRLNAKAFTGGSRAMSNLQSSYAKSVESLGIQRGLAGSSARHQDIRRMYANLNNVMNIPEVRKGESAEEYKSRILDQFKTMHAAGMRSIDDRAVRSQRNIDEERIRSQEEIEIELHQTRNTAYHEIRTLKKELNSLAVDKNQASVDLESYQRQMEELAQQMFDIRAELDEAEEEREAVDFYRKVRKGLDVIAASDPEGADDIREQINYVIGTAEYQERLEQEQQEL